MKFFRFSLIYIRIILTLISGCTHSKSDSEMMDFKAHFFTELKGVKENGFPCAGTLNLLNIQEGSGMATGLGKFKTRITFCFDMKTLEYINGEGSFMADSGEAIFFMGSGQIKPSKNPKYDLEFQDSFLVTGGTGQFEGASGTLTSNSLVKLETHRTDHEWSGTIKLKK